MNSLAKSGWLTLAGFVVLCGITAACMWFITQRLTISGAYWLVPIFGALGGFVGGVLRSENAFELCVIQEGAEIKTAAGNVKQRKQSKICLGTLGEIAVGLGGAVGAVFLFGGTLKFDEHDPKTYVLLISVSFLAGAFGKRVVEAAGKRLFEEVKEAKNDAKTAQSQADHAAAMGYTLNAGIANNQGDSHLALTMTDYAIELDDEYISAYVEKGRALKRLGRLSEALETIEKALRMNSTRPDLTYNHACYKLLTGGSTTEVIDELRKTFDLRPDLKEAAKNDPDLDSLKTNPEFIKLLAETIAN